MRKKAKKKVYFIEIRIIQNVFIYKNFLSISLPSAFATKSAVLMTSRILLHTMCSY